MGDPENQPDMHHNTSKMSNFSSFQKSSENLQNHSKMLQNMFLECPGARGTTFEKFMKSRKITIFIIFGVIFGRSDLTKPIQTALKLSLEGISRFFVIILETFPRGLLRYDLD